MRRPRLRPFRPKKPAWQPDWKPAPIGHNQGPPLDTGRAWRRTCWKKAQQAAWKSPPVETVRRRSRRAKELGLTYRQYSLVLLDRGVHLAVLFFDLGGTLLRVEADEIYISPSGQTEPLPGVVDKLKRLRNCKVFVVTNQAGVATGLLTAEQAQAFVTDLDALCGGVLTDHRICFDPPGSGSAFRKPAPGMVLDLLAAHRVAASAAVLVGDSENDRACAEAADLALFLWAWDYFET